LEVWDALLVVCVCRGCCSLSVCVCDLLIFLHHRCCPRACRARSSSPHQPHQQRSQGQQEGGKRRGRQERRIVWEKIRDRFWEYKTSRKSKLLSTPLGRRRRRWRWRWRRRRGRWREGRGRRGWRNGWGRLWARGRREFGRRCGWWARCHAGRVRWRGRLWRVGRR